MALAKGSGHPGIFTNVMAPIANTRMYSGDVAEGRLRPESVAGAVTWLASPACDLNGWIVKAADGTLALQRLTEVATRNIGAEAEDAVAAGAALTAMAGEANDGEDVP